MKTSHKRSFVGLAAGMAFGIGLSVSLNALAFKQNVPDSDLPLEDLQKFTEVFSRVKQDFVEQPDGSEMINNAIRGMLNGLDPHSDYLDEQRFKELQEGTSGEFGGLGIEVGMEDGFVKVISPIDDTPAQKAGLQAGDLIIRLDDKQVKGMTLSDAVKIMRGKPGTDIKLLVVRDGEDKPLTISITRAVIKVRSVKNRMLEPGFGYLRISSFQSRTTENLLDAIETLTKENGEELRGIVLDLRNNPGGVLHAAVGVSDAFLNKGKIVYTEGRIADSQMEYHARDGDELKGKPIVVLVNQGSASASEIVAGALQDHKRALILGQKTFGKGSVQTVLPLDETSALKLTTARYFTPKGRSIQAQGIEPDIEIKPLTLKGSEEEEYEPLSEKDYSGHLSNPNKDSEDDSNQAKEEPAPDVKKVEPLDKNLAEDDYQLYEALNILKGMDLVMTRQADQDS